MHLSLPDAIRVVGLTTWQHVLERLPAPALPPVTEGDVARWFDERPPVLFHPTFGQASGPGFTRISPPTGTCADPRCRWEISRDQDLAARIALSPPDDHRVVDSAARRLDRLIAVPPPNAMEAALQAISWLQVARFLAARQTPLNWRVRVATRLLALGHYIERHLHEVPLGGNHYLTHAVGLLFIGRLLPGGDHAERWADIGRRIVAVEVGRQFRDDGGGYEQSTGYHLFSLELVLAATLLLRGQGEQWEPAVRHRIHQAARFAASLLRPDGSIPLLGDDDSGRVLQWSSDSRARDVCSIAAAVFDDPELARAASPATTAVAWLLGEASAVRLRHMVGEASRPPRRICHVSTGLHVVRDGGRVHAVLWSRDPRRPAMLAHGHADHNSVDIWIGEHLVRDPGSGVYLGDPAMRNRLRRSGAHSTLTIDSAELTRFCPDDLFFMPATTCGALAEWRDTAAVTSVATVHNGFRHLAGAPVHRRSLSLSRLTRELTIDDEVIESSPGGGMRLINAWWHWTKEPILIRTEEVSATRRHHWLTVGPMTIRLDLPTTATLVAAEPFPWSPHYGVIAPGRRTAIRYHGVLPLHMTLQISY